MDYYRLLEKYNGDLSKATEEELYAAARANPNDPPSALRLARRKWDEKKKEEERLIRRRGLDGEDKNHQM